MSPNSNRVIGVSNPINQTEIQCSFALAVLVTLVLAVLKTKCGNLVLRKPLFGTCSKTDYNRTKIHFILHTASKLKCILSTLNILLYFLQLVFIVSISIIVVIIITVFIIFIVFVTAIIVSAFVVVTVVVAFIGIVMEEGQNIRNDNVNHR